MKGTLAFLLPLLAEASIYAQLKQPGYGVPSKVPKAMKPVEVLKGTPKFDSKATKETLVWGPFRMKASNATHSPLIPMTKLDKNSDYINFQMDAMCKDCVILSAHPRVVIKDAKSPEATAENGGYFQAALGNGLYVHHIVMNDMGRSMIPQPLNPTCGFMKGSTACIAGKPPGMLAKLMPKMSVFVATGGDGGEVSFTPKDRSVKSGFYKAPTDKLIGTAEVVNYDNYEKDVFISLDYEYLQGRAPETKDVAFNAIDMSGCFKLDLDLPSPNKTDFTSPDFTVVNNGYIVSLTPHLHDGGVGVQILKNKEVVCDSKALYGGENGKTVIGGEEWETITDYTPCKMPIKLSCGDKITLKANYDVQKHRLRPMNQNHEMTAEAMALSLFIFAEGH